MYDINYKNLKAEKLIYRILIYIGLFILLILDSIVVVNKIRIKSLDSYIVTRHIEIEMNEKDGEISYKPIYYYTVDENTYECKPSSTSSNKPIIRNGKVYYDSKNPSRCMTDYTIRTNKILIILNIIPLLFLIPGIILKYRTKKKIKKIKKLNKIGTLVKGLKYNTQDTSISINGRMLKKIIIEYRLKTGELITLTSIPMLVIKNKETVDLLIDEENPDNYYIDFEINRKTGNRPEDYYEEQRWN